MTALSMFLKPFLWPLMRFTFLLLARCGAIVVLRVLPDGRLKAVLFDRTFLDRHRWIYGVALFGTYGGILGYCALNLV